MVDPAATSYVIDVIESNMTPTLPDEFMLDQNRPKPFNPTTTNSYSLPRPGHVKLTIYDTLGQTVRELVNEFQGGGVHNIEWDGRDAAGQPTSSEIYFYRLDTGEFGDSKNMMLLK